MSATTAVVAADSRRGDERRAGSRRSRARRRVELRHWWAGWQDGRRRRPSLSEGAAIPDRLALLISGSQSALEQRWQDLLEQTRLARLELAVIPDELQRALDRTDEAEHALAAHLAGGPAVERRFGEERLPDALVRTRRKRQHADRAAELTVVRDRSANYVHTKRQRQSELRAQLRQALDSARAAARADLTGYDELATAYRRGALRTHVDPEALEHHAHRFTIPRPDWVGYEDVEQFLRAAQTGSDHA